MPPQFRTLGPIDYGILAQMLSRVLEVSEDSGVVALGTTTSITDPMKGWATNDWAGAKVHIIHKNVKYVRTISSNTENTLVFSPPLPEAPSAGDYYAIRRAVDPAKVVTFEGTVTMDGSEKTVFEFVGTGRISGHIDLQNMTAGDVVVIRQYIKVKDGGPYKKYAEETYSGAQSLPLIHVTPKSVGVALKVTIQQTAGSYKSFDYNFVKEL
jgi:hypothetical protein